MNTNQLRLRATRSANSGFTLIEISLVIALLLGLIAIVFLGLGSYKNGADKANCKMQLAAVQKAVRANANMNNLAVGAALTSTDVFGANKLMPTTPLCPAGGTLTWGATIPAIGTPYGDCSIADHKLTNTAAVGDW